eukprot:gene4175-4729_t
MVKGAAFCFICQLFPTRVDHEKSDDAWTVKGIRQWHKMKGRGKSKQGKLSGHLSSNSHKASLDALNEFLQLLSDDVSEKVKAEIETAQFIAVTADTTPDASHLDQLSVVLRYVTPSRAIHERLLDMNDVDKKTGDGQALAILTSLRKKKLALNQLYFSLMIIHLLCQAGSRDVKQRCRSILKGAYHTFLASHTGLTQLWNIVAKQVSSSQPCLMFWR